MQKLKWQYKTDLEKAGLKVAKLLQHGLALPPSPRLGRVGAGGPFPEKRSHFQAFWVGGIVRNMLMKRESDNIDIATDATPEQIEKMLNQVKIKNTSVGKQFGSILAIIHGFKIEITTFRAEGRYSDKRHPDAVEFIRDYLQDAKRRDFTINALYFDPTTKELSDPTIGIKDLGLKLLRFVGDPKKRIDEDALRMLRGVRLATQLGFKLERNSFAAIKTRAKYIQGISGERVKAELDKILLSRNRADGIKLLDDIGLLKFIVPESQAIRVFSHKSKLYHLEGSIFDHTLLALGKITEPNLDLIYAILFHDIGKPQKQQKVLKAEGWVISTKGHAATGASIFLAFANKFKFSKTSRDNTAWLIQNHMLMFEFCDMRPFKQLQLAWHPMFLWLLRHFYYDEAATKRKNYLDDHHKKYLRSLKIGKSLLQKIADTKDLVRVLAKGDLIMKHSGLKPGRDLGSKIQEVKTQIVFGKIKTEANLKEYLSAKIAQEGLTNHSNTSTL